MGARPLRRAIQRLIEDPIADQVLQGGMAEGNTILIDRDGDKMAITLTRPDGTEEVVSTSPDDIVTVEDTAVAAPAAAASDEGPQPDAQ